jgi:hypothetical protein
MIHSASIFSGATQGMSIRGQLTSTLPDTLQSCEGKLPRFNVFDCDGQPMAVPERSALLNSHANYSRMSWAGYATDAETALEASK